MYDDCLKGEMALQVITEATLDELKKKAVQLRRDIIEMIYEAGSGHPGGSLSVLDILILLYYRVMKIDAASCRYHDRDRLVLSKGHACPRSMPFWRTGIFLRRT